MNTIHHTEYNRLLDTGFLWGIVQITPAAARVVRPTMLLSSCNWKEASPAAALVGHQHCPATDRCLIKNNCYASASTAWLISLFRYKYPDLWMINKY